MPLQQKRPLEDFFKPYGRTTTTIPQKRPSPSSASNEELVARKCAPKTPAKTVTFKDLTPTSVTSPIFTPNSHRSLPIRSPQSSKSVRRKPTIQRQLFEDIKRSPLKEIKYNTSFTFSDASERSQKVIEGGQVVAIKDSDDDTDSLESLDDILGRKQDATNTSNSSPLEDLEAERVKTLSMFTSGRSVPIVGKEKLRALYAKERTIKFDLGSILDDHFGDEEAQLNISKMRADFDGSEDLDSDDRLDKHLLASVIQTGDTDQEDVARLLHAVERTEALSTRNAYAFIRSDNFRNKSPRKAGFPRSGIPDQLWEPKNVEAQNRAYLSGYMSDLARSGSLTDEVLKWTFGQVIKEPRADLRHAYISCLNASNETWIRLNVTANDIQSLFQNLGADPEALRDPSLIEAKYQPRQEQSDRGCKYLLSALQMLQSICKDLDFLALSKLSSLLLRLTVDKAVMSNNRVCAAVDGLLETLLNLKDHEAQSHVYGRLVSDATAHLLDPQLQAQLLSHILPTTSQATRLRITLANVFLLGPSILDPTTKQSNATITELSNHVSTSPSFSPTRRANSPPIDYSALTALTQVLNVAISSGNPSLRSTLSDVPSREMRSTKLPVEEVAFNDSVDNLADNLHDLFVSIKDTGASHMRRTEAKDALQALYFRLLFSVRTKVRKKKHVFDMNGEMKGGSFKPRWVSGSEWREREKSGEFMKRFLAKRDTVGE